MSDTPSKPTDYVLGYGSLIQTESRRRNLGDEAPPLPVRLHGWRRGWNIRGPGVGFVGTFLGATEEAGATTGGVLVPVAPDEWPDLDRRENGYRRVAIDRSRLEILCADGGSPPDGATLYVYATEEIAPPHAEAPILQSYVDICLSGCFEIDDYLGTGRAFAEEFIASTNGWDAPWVNDRVYPRAAFRTMPAALEIDRLLRANLPEAFASIRIE
ncbi:MAG: gamma-glutamylcyclotransferase family protein [Planctomycetota bacterium]